MVMKKLLVLVAVFVAASLFFGGRALAYNPFSTACGTSSSTSKSPVCDSANQGQTGDPLGGTGGIIARVTNLVALMGGIAAVVIIMISGFRYITSAGEASKVSAAKDTILYAVIGLVVIALARTIIIYVVNKVYA